MSNGIFFAVCDGDDKVMSIYHDRLKSIKAVFYSVKDAEKVISQNPDEDLHIEEVNIVGVNHDHD